MIKSTPKVGGKGGGMFGNLSTKTIGLGVGAFVGVVVLVIVLYFVVFKKDTPKPTPNDPPKPPPNDPPKPPPNDKEVYFYDKDRYSFPQYTSNSMEQNKANIEANIATAASLGAVQASKEQLKAEWQGGLDSCNAGWIANIPGNDDSRVYIPYRTNRGEGSGCSNPNVLSGDLPFAAGIQGTEKWGLWLYGKKPTNLPDCNGPMTPGQPCVGKYSPSKVSKYS